MASIDDLRRRGNTLSTVVRPAHHRQNASEHQIREHQRDVADFLHELSNMQDQRRYTFAGDTIEGIYTTVNHSGFVTAGQRRAINNIRRGCGEEEI